MTSASKLGTFRNIATGWFVLQCWGACIACAGAIVALLGVFGEANAKFTADFLRQVFDVPLLFDTQSAALATMVVLGAASFVILRLVEKFWFRIVMIFAAGGGAAWAILTWLRVS